MEILLLIMCNKNIQHKYVIRENVKSLRFYKLANKQIKGKHNNYFINEFGCQLYTFS